MSNAPHLSVQLACGPRDARGDLESILQDENDVVVSFFVSGQQLIGVAFGPEILAYASHLAAEALAGHHQGYLSTMKPFVVAAALSFGPGWRTPVRGDDFRLEDGYVEAPDASHRDGWPKAPECRRIASGRLADHDRAPPA